MIRGWLTVDSRRRITSHRRESSVLTRPVHRRYSTASCTNSATSDSVNFRSVMIVIICSIVFYLL